MKLTLTIFSFFLLSFSLAQKKVENLSSDKDVVKFVYNFFNKDNEEDLSWKSFQLIDGREWFGSYNLNKSLQDSLLNLDVYKWQKVDFNFDGKLDLIVCGKRMLLRNQEYFLMAFLSESSNDPYEDDIQYSGVYDLKSLIIKGSSSYPYYFSLIDSKERTPLIRITRWDFGIENNSISMDSPFIVDTICFLDNYIINYSKEKDTSLFNKIKFESKNIDGKKIKVVIDCMNNTDTSVLEIIRYDSEVDSSVLLGKITKYYYNGLMKLINYGGVNLIHNKDKIDNGLAGNKLSMYSSDGTYKEINDISGYRTYSLSAIYGWFGWLLNYTAASYIQQKKTHK
ncbi:MAG: hypothetical protein DI598_15005 [Pseudopedobacter saltans]|uniref:VCBS repeat-containing protein n=1 Tax=Pseudopedobacter saltans TaxID=151895 RepID=A0A2W5EI81_9SPHI|nr:MAG: hypothetical protein DI598_15005 [Pseudopedobacter saltans]